MAPDAKTRLSYGEEPVMNEIDQAELRRGLRVHMFVLAASAIVLGVAAVFAAVVDVPGGVLSREPQITLGGAYYTGILSNLGALIWMVGVVMAAVGWSTSITHGDRRMFLAGTAVGVVLLVDDFFLIHDWVEANQDGPFEEWLLASYFLAALAMVATNRQALGTVGVAGLVVALGLLALSGLLDNFFNDLDQLIEDGFKFAGISTWATVWTLRAHPWQFRPDREALDEVTSRKDNGGPTGGPATTERRTDR